MISASPTRRSSMAIGNFSTGTGTANNSGNFFGSKSKPQIISPRIQENTLGEIIKYRNEIMADFKELGQPDLVYLTKYDKPNKVEIGEYHYVIGINTSSIIQPFMYIQTIQLNDKEPATNKHMKVGTYCSYNIFSKGDLRIRCQFPGSVTPMIQFIPANKAKITMNINNDDEIYQHLWKETYASSLIRCLLFSDSIERHLPGMCKFNPIQSTKDAKEAIKLLCEFIPKGIETGCADIINRASIVNNHLIDSLLKLLSITKYYDFAINEIRTLMKDQRINLNVLIVKILLLKNDNAKAVRLMHDCLVKVPRDGWMLYEQANFLINQNRPDLALVSAIKSVECLPGEFLCWKNMILVYILQKDLKNALLALNSSPMYTNKRKDIYAAIKPKSFDFPFPLEGKLEFVWRDCETFGCISGIGGIVEFSPQSEVSKTSNFRLKVYEETKLNRTFKEAYDILALMNKQCGWSQLLKIRSEIFVMEDEYNETVKSEKQKQNEKTGNDEEVKNTSTISLDDISNKFKNKRLSEKWLDSLFLIFYENLKNVLIYQNDLITKENVQYSPLEWELIGDECFKVHFYQEGLPPMETCLTKRFSPFAAYKLLNLFITRKTQEKLFNELETSIDSDFNSDIDLILKIMCKLISWTSRYYGEFPLICFQVLNIIMNLPDSGELALKSKLEFIVKQCEDENKERMKQLLSDDKAMFKEMENSQGVMFLLDRYISWLSQFESQED